MTELQCAPIPCPVDRDDIVPGGGGGGGWGGGDWGDTNATNGMFRIEANFTVLLSREFCKANIFTKHPKDNQPK